ncbi:MAG: diguanylate cyclase [Gemmataceae bacterium]|nr:diguanylate cyclase [Gemmataceae bacterium]
MTDVAPERRRVLLAAGADRLTDLRALFTDDRLATWDALVADSLSHARFIVQHHPCDLLLVSSDMLGEEHRSGLNWLIFQSQAPMLMLADDQPGPYARAFEMGFDITLPMHLALADPALLDVAMNQAVHAWQRLKQHDRTKLQLAETQRHVDRLIQLIWRMTPRHDEHWYPQRHVLERLSEEVARCQRYRVPLSIAIGEVATAAEFDQTVMEWSATEIVRAKRRCDIVGQYGPNGFLLIMVHTLKPGGVACCQRLQQFLEHPRENEPPTTPVRTYFGLASAPTENLSVQKLLHHAEQNLDLARRPDGSRIVAN